MSGRLQNELLSLASKAGVIEDERDRMAEHLARAQQKVAELTARIESIAGTARKMIAAVEAEDDWGLCERKGLIEKFIKIISDEKI